MPFPFQPRLLLCAIVTVSVIPSDLCAQQLTSPAPAQAVLQRFPISTYGPILLPVTINGRDYQFMLSTGFTHTTYDSSLATLLGPPVFSVPSHTPQSPAKVNVYRPPDARIGTMRFQLDSPVCVVDLQRIRDASGENIYGLIGMDYLRNLILRIDNDQREIAFLRELGPDIGPRMPIRFDPDGLPRVPISIAGLDEPTMCIPNTGAISPIELRPDLYNTLASAGRIREKGRQHQAGYFGSSAQRYGFTEAATFAGHQHKHLLAGQSHDNLLGLYFLSRYNMIFDFPNGAMYVTKSARFTEPDVADQSGLHMLWLQGKPKVVEVEPGSPAAASGIQPGDVVIKVDDTQASDIRMIPLRRMLCTEGKKIQLVLERGNKQLTALLLLRD